VKQKIKYLLLQALWFAAFSCMDYKPTGENDFDYRNDNGVFIVNEGNFMYGNASLSYYSPEKKIVENEVFIQANGIKLGDVAQSMTIRNGLGYIVVNNSGIIFIIDINTFKVTGTITGFVSPRHIHFVSDNKLYVSDLYGAKIYIVNPSTRKITGSISTGKHKSTEQMLQHGKFVYTNCWSYDNKILIIDSETDQIADSITVGIQPNSMVIDKNGKLWVLADGGYENNPYGYEIPSLYCINTANLTVEQKFDFRLNDSPSSLCINNTGDTIYFINKSVWRMSVLDTNLPPQPFIPYNGTLYYGLGISPHTSEIYLTDAIDYVQKGKMYKYTPQAICVDTVTTGICPVALCFKW
jgi:DNA-binding beta-propeller fold protein YncE